MVFRNFSLLISKAKVASVVKLYDIDNTNQLVRRAVPA